MYGALALDNYGALALDNPNYYRRAGRAARGTEARHLQIKAIRKTYRDQNKNWYRDPGMKEAYRAELDAAGLKVFGSDADGNRLFEVSEKTASTPKRREQIGKARRKFVKKFKTGRRTKAKAFTTRAKMGLQAKTATKALKVAAAIGGRGTRRPGTIVGARKEDGSLYKVGSTIPAGGEYFQLVSNIPNQRKYNDARLQRKAALQYWQGPGDARVVYAKSNPGVMPLGSKDIYGEYKGDGFTYKSPEDDPKPKGSGSLEFFTDSKNYVPIMAADAKVLLATKGERLTYGHRKKAKKRKGGKRKGSGGSSAWMAHVKATRDASPGMSYKDAMQAAAKTYSKSNPRRKPPVGSKAYYRAKHRHMANKNPMGALALDNYGALALDNGIVDDVKSSALSSGKLIGFGLVGGLAHALVGEQIEDLVERIPVLGERAYGLEIPEAVPVIGGMELDHTITGLVAGIALITAGGLAKGRLNIPVVGDLGSILMAIGAGAAAVGPAMDVTEFISEDGGEGDMGALALDNYGGLALENYGGLALDNEGTFGDGMAYQIGQIAESNGSTEFEQASLADANYSGADFDLGEGEALINGRKHFFRRYGHPTRRIHTPGSSMATSHLAGQPGHRWGWLIKMIGWSNTQKLAAMSPSQRVSTIKQLRANALQTFQQIQAQQAQLSAAAIAPELGAMGPEGVSGAFGSYGSTLFSGEGL